MVSSLLKWGFFDFYSQHNPCISFDSTIAAILWTWLGTVYVSIIVSVHKMLMHDSSRPYFSLQGWMSPVLHKLDKSLTTSVRALNALLLLLADQTELKQKMTGLVTLAIWDKICVVTDLCLHLHRYASFWQTDGIDGLCKTSTMAQPVKPFPGKRLLDVPGDPKCF